MRLDRTLRTAFALLLALMLPLHGYAAMPACEHHAPTHVAAPAGAAVAAVQHHCGGGATVTHHHDCGTCCCGAVISIARFPAVALRRAVAANSSAAPSSPSKGLLDRLDRPPRSSRA
jgi:hypothetical protein